MRQSLRIDIISSFSLNFCMWPVRKEPGKGFVWSTGEDVVKSAVNYCTSGKRQPMAVAN
jgi:hypothetical protein